MFVCFFLCCFCFDKRKCLIWNIVSPPSHFSKNVAYAKAPERSLFIRLRYVEWSAISLTDSMGISMFRQNWHWSYVGVYSINNWQMLHTEIECILLNCLAVIGVCRLFGESSSVFILTIIHTSTHHHSPFIIISVAMLNWSYCILLACFTWAGNCFP